ncbi:MAG TPA: hypothetical protein VN706_06510 [Gemmatimonadaceae bacterium]|nr:hypothetical protein [Gemmatimonadaceae bacterium]
MSPDHNRLDEASVNARDGQESRVVDWAESPVTYDDLVRYFRQTYEPEMAEELIAGLEPAPRPGETWSTDILLVIANFSPEHTRRVRNYLHWTEEQMAVEIGKLKK